MTSIMQTIKRLISIVKPYIISLRLSLRKIFISIYSSFTSFVLGILNSFYTVKPIWITIFLIALFVIGRILLNDNYVKYSLGHQIILSLIAIIQIYMIRFLWKQSEMFIKEVAGVSKDLGYPIKKLQLRQKSILSIVLPIFPCIRFAQKQLAMSYVPNHIGGYFASVFASIVLYLGIISYYQLIMTIIAFYEISKIEKKSIPFDYPRDINKSPEWLNLLVELFVKSKYTFFTVGMLYTFEYLMLMPENVVLISDNQIIINANNPTGFLLGWLVIFVFIVIATPMITMAFGHYVKKIAKMFTNKAIDEISTLFSASKSTEIAHTLSFIQVFTIASDFKRYLPKQKNIYPAITTGVSFALNLLKLYESVLLKLLESFNAII